MELVRKYGRRILIDGAGYALIVAAVLTGWLPGPGGVPLLVAGLGLLSIHNTWAMRLRVSVLTHGGRLVKLLFPRWPWLEWGYDILAFLLLMVCFLLQLRHANYWEMALGVSAFFIALFIALTNRDRLNRLRGKQKA